MLDTQSNIHLMFKIANDLSGDLNTGIFFPSADTIAFTEGGTEAMRIDSSGSVGIRVTPSIYWGGNFALDVGAPGCGITSRQNRELSMCQNAAFNKYAANGTASRIDMGNDSVIAFLNAASGTAGDTISFSERMRIPSSGGLAVGTTSLGTAFMRVANTSATGRMLEIVQESASSTTDGSIYSYINTASGTGFVHYTAQSLTQVVFKVIGNGNVQNLNNSYGSLSDIKIKKDIIDASSQWNDIKNVRVRKFRLKDDPTQFFQIGVVAQELEEVSPNLIEEIPDYKENEFPVLDDNGNPVLNKDGTPQVKKEKIQLDTTTKSVKYSILYMKAIKALQEAMERIETLEAKVTTLENK